MDSFTNSEDPDEMLHNAAFYLGLHRLNMVKKSSSDTKINLFYLLSDTLCT